MVLVLALPFGVRAQPLDGDALWSLQARPNARLGLAFPGADPQFYPLMSQAGLGVVRVTANWGRISPQRGQWNFSGLDRRVRALGDLGIDAFITFESTADWATQQGQPVKNATPNDMAEWAQFVATVVERYDGDGQGDMPRLRRPVRYYQAANEFMSPTNRSGGWAGTHAELLTYINTAHDAVKSADRRAVFVLGGIAAFNMDIALLDAGLARFEVRQSWSARSQTVFDPRDLDNPVIRDLIENRFKQIITRARYDMADVHLYGPESRDGARLAYMRQLSRRPVLSSECGGPSLDYGGQYSGQAHYAAVLERNLETLAAGASFCLWFGLGEGITATYGNRRVQLYDRQEREKPGVHAYRLLARLIDDRTEVTRLGADAFVLRTGSDRVCIATHGRGHGALALACGADAPALCVTNAQDQRTSAGDLRNLPQFCPEDGVVIAGSGLSQRLAVLDE
ncbi:hypothetical protein PSJ8397_02410 [Pseudooctadecabacter jejudonensis]|uniref:Uncharacterized protein n=2 Tax=Pseudooctadecabacter jejudonensis TaxID=1391910 RepID=A0A1Y5SVG2_9RHOB|nr:hypothetical protein PSJ8397_02410 [Pseudooctadecabacter jejudonensis]